MQFWYIYGYDETLMTGQLGFIRARFAGSSTPPPTGVSIEDKVTMGMRQGTQQADVFMGGFG